MSDNEMISVQIIKTNERNILVQRVNADAFIGASVDVCVKTRTINSLAYQSPIPPYGI